MGLGAAIYTRLTGHAGTTALVSTRVYPNTAPQDATLPYVVYEQESARRLETFGGSSGNARAVVEIAAWDETYDGARALGEQIRLALEGFSGTVASVVIDYVTLDGDRDEYFAPGSGEEVGLHSVDQDYGFWFQETVPP